MNRRHKIEIEFRARFNADTYRELKKILDARAENLGDDDKDVYFFIFSDKLLKVVNNVSKKNAEIVLKLNKIGRGSDFEEIVVPIEQKYTADAVRIFTEMKLTGNIMRSFQKRQNYFYKVAELALKYGDVWGHHLELEKVITDRGKKNVAERLLRDIATELGVELMTDKQLKEFTQKAEQNYKGSKSNRFS